MTHEQAIGEINLHYHRGLDHYTPIANIGDCMSRLNQYWDKYRAAHNACVNPDGDAEMLRRLAQVAGLCLRGLVDLGAQERGRDQPGPTEPS